MASGVGIALGWLAVVLLLGALALPVTARVFAPQSARGTAFAIPAGLAAVTLGTFWLGRLSLRFAPLAAVGLLAGTSLVLVRRRRDDPLPVRAYAEAAAVFATGFVVALVVQAATPEITAGGEAYWNFALVQSLLRTAQLPPQDPWFAGEPVRYYYGGHLLVAALAESMATPGRYAFGLGKAVAYGALVVAAYGVAGSIAAARGRPHRPAGLLAAFFVGLASNLHPPLWVGLSALPEAVAAPIAATSPFNEVVATGTASFDLVDAAHFSFTNTDFPVYTLFFRGIHPHVVSPPFLLLLAGVLVAYWYTPAEARRRRVGLLVLTTPLVGLVALVNTWSLPTACGLVALTVAMAPTHPRTLVAAPERTPTTSPVRTWLWRLAAGATIGLLVGVVGLAWVAPYVLRGMAGDPGLGLFPPRSDAWFFVIGYGGFLLAFVAYLAVELRSDRWSRQLRTTAVLFVAGLFTVSWLGDFAGLAIVGPVVIGALYLLSRDRTDALALLIVAGAGLVLLVEVAYVRESAEPGRYNTVYKVYMQTWALWAPAAGLAVARLVEDGTGARRLPGWRHAFAAVLLISLSGYGLAGVGGHVTYALGDEARPTLDGLAYLDDDRPDQAAAIDWLAGHSGQPTIVSAPVPEHRLYRFNASPAASLTGLPTLVGWNHQADYRGEAAYRERVAVVDTVYAGTRAERARTLREHDVAFIWVGEGERERYVTIDYSREPGITTAFRRGDVTVYRVDTAALDPG